MQARKASARDEVPVGAVIVDESGAIIARGYNKTEQQCTQAAHAEIEAIRKAGKIRGNWRCHGLWLYVTLEPCCMCMHLIKLSRMAGVVFGAPSPLFGYRLDKGADLAVYKKDALQIVMQSNEESKQLLQYFFQQKRKGGGYGKK